ncbi:MAG: hypothetical protein JNL45_11935 [Hyphomicrobium sp.]|nr:hypothetical protein [Hyphomicrobium sp.]
MTFTAAAQWPPRATAQEMEEYLLGLAQLLNDRGATETARWLVLRPILFGLAPNEREAVFHWCEVLRAEDRAGSGT